MPKIYAAFVGINAYPQFPLSGCIKDVLDIDLLLREQTGQQAADLQYEPRYFLAPNKTDERRIKDYKAAKKIDFEIQAPTFQVVTTEVFAHLKNARDGDTCLLYYSGHGSQIDAPEVFWHTKADRKNETLVCVDSRDAASADARDIIDKELAFLLWDALKGKDVHCLVIMDCCHSGNNTRAFVEEQEEGFTYRYVSSARNKVPLEKYIGYETGFYKVKNGKAEIDIAKYVHLAAARDAEKAQESAGGGVFSTKLLEVLRSGGTTKSYRELMQSLAITVSNRAATQHPVAFARDDKDLDLKFLGNGVKPYTASFEVRYDFEAGKWILYGGAMQHIMPSGNQAKTLVSISSVGGPIIAAVTQVAATTSVLEAEELKKLVKENESYKAVIISMANPAIKISIGARLLAQQPRLSELKEACKTAAPLFFKIDFNKNEAADYAASLTEDDAFVLTKAGTEVPLFQRAANATAFVKQADAVCKWISVSELKNANTGITKDDFVFTLEKLEGVINGNNLADWDELAGATIKDWEPGKEEVFSYRNDNQPAFRLRISLKNGSLSRCYIGALYMDSLFGIDPGFIQADEGALVKDGSPIALSWNRDGKEYKTIPLRLDAGFKRNQINEITEFLKIIVSTEPINLDVYKQEPLKLDIPVQRNRNVENARGVGVDTLDTEGNAEERSDWTVFTFPIRIVGPHKEKTIAGGGEVDFSSFTLQAPATFAARAFAATGNDQQQKLQTVTRGIDEEADRLSQMVLPPETLWEHTITDDGAFTRGMSPASQNGLQVLELMPANGDANLQLNEGEELIISPKQRTRGRDAGAWEEVVVPYGFDEATQLYFPLGISDNEGNIHIRTLPQPTPGRLAAGEEKLTRSLGGSVKLFFKKIFHQGVTNTLTLYELKPGSEWKQLTDDPQAMKQILTADKTAPVVLMIHGIIGDMRSITESMKQVAEFSTVVRYVLTYDYENMATPIEKTAEKLHTSLLQAGFDDVRKLCIVAHSMGGLVTRCLVEKAGGNAYVKQVVFAGTPHGGSEIAHLKTCIGGLLAHVMNVTGPLKWAITGLSFLMKKLEADPLNTLMQMNPGSGFLTELAKSSTGNGVPYYVMGGNTALLKEGYDGDDFFLKKLSEVLKEKLVYPGLTQAVFNHKPNDIAVSLESMQCIPGFQSTGMHVLASDHMSYFTEANCRKKLLELIACKAETTTTHN